MATSFRQIINKAVKDKRFLVVPGAHDALSARLIQKIGFETYFIGGFPAVGARYGVPGFHSNALPSVTTWPTPGNGKCGANTSSWSFASRASVAWRVAFATALSLSKPMVQSGFCSEMTEL